MADALVNFPYSTVATAPSPADTGVSLIVQPGHGARFPTPPFNAAVWAANTLPTPANATLVRVTAIVSDTLTIIRQAEGSPVRSILVGDQIDASITAQFIGLGLINRRPSYNFKIPAGHSVYVAKQFEIPTGVQVEIDPDGVLEIG